MSISHHLASLGPAGPVGIQHSLGELGEVRGQPEGQRDPHKCQGQTFPFYHAAKGPLGKGHLPLGLTGSFFLTLSLGASMPFSKFIS